MSQRRQINGYELLDPIGSGTFSNVFVARHTQTRKLFAIKYIRRSLSKKDLSYIDSELDILERVHHDHIIRFYEGFRYDGTRYLVFEYCKHGDLSKFLEKHRTLQETTVQMAAWCICCALHELSKNNIAHRDLKLANILITEDYRLKLADFGFSKQTEDSLMKSQCGTPITMAPEILEKKLYKKENCDTWSLGIIVYQMLFGEAPWMPRSGEKGGMDGLVEAIRSRYLTFWKEIEVSEQCKHFISSCLDKNNVTRPTITKILEHPWLKGGEELLRHTDNMFERYLFETPNVVKYCTSKHLDKLLKDNHLANIKDFVGQAVRLFKGCKLPEVIGDIARYRFRRLAESEITFRLPEGEATVKLENSNYFKDSEDRYLRSIGIDCSRRNSEKEMRPSKFRRMTLRYTINAFLDVLQKEKDNRLASEKLDFLMKIMSMLPASPTINLTITIYPNFDLPEQERSLYVEYLKRLRLPEKLIAYLNDLQRRDSAETITESFSLSWEEKDIQAKETAEVIETTDILMMLKANLRCHTRLIDCY